MMSIAAPPGYRVGVINVLVASAKIELWDKNDWQKYLDAAIKACDFIWTIYGSKCVFLGDIGTINPFVGGLINLSFAETINKVYLQ